VTLFPELAAQQVLIEKGNEGRRRIVFAVLYQQALNYLMTL
jgi:hypothetical protein